jgi:toxin-antitoxin system PIN domain toxin
VIVFDANLLLYAYNSSAPNHAQARLSAEKILSGQEAVGLPWQTIFAFLRIITNRQVRGQRLSMEEAVAIVEEWMALPNVHLLAPGERHWTFLKRMLLEGKAGGPLATDAELAALTMENGGVLYTTDRDFARFPGLKWVNPLASA